MKTLAGCVLCAVAAIAVARSGAGRTSCPPDFAVRVVGAAADAPAVAGTCVVEDGRPVFRPALPFISGVEYSVRTGGREVDRLGTRRIVPPPSVTARIFPTADVLPANQLKLYVEFSGAMSLGESRRRIRLLDGAGREVSNAFLSVEEEMWDAQRRRLTVLFDPGRVKRGLKANLQSGAPLREGRLYTLVVDREWPDARSAPLLAGVSKRFRVGVADRQVPSASSWTVTAPAAGTRTPLTLSFAEPMDYAVALHAIHVIDDRGQRLEGTSSLAAREERWQFTPARPWSAEPHTLYVDPRIEDLAGNNLARPFDLDLRNAPAPGSGAVRLSFTPRDYSSRRTTIGSTRVARLAGM